ncbi:ROK family transcriptional regulator [Mesoterricola sediminis]|uniref:Transcriptional regulator n=1 Tax=Mesoterricola sediminis TaxID=2927980 RepID=A0AA48GRY9_9BACT|nr:ROK family transcriptional regulator [Mesoterricola sediminis]BDU76524.1 transcriptional regulator [Mesoterricola sediminis]
MTGRKRKELPAYIRGRVNLDELLASRRVMQFVHERGPATQGETSEALGLSLGACNLHFQRLEYEGLLKALRLDPEGRGPGRPRSHWEFARETNAALGLVFDPPHVFIQLEDFAASLLWSQGASLRSCRNRGEVASRVARLAEKAVAEASARRLELRSAFAALPGVLDPATGAVRRAVNFTALEGLDVAALMQERFQVPTQAHSLGAAYFYGEAADLAPGRTALVMYWDLGLGFAFGRNRQLLTVHGGDEGGRVISELGHISVDAHGPLCNCGERGCLEAYAGGWVLLRRFAPPGATLEDLVEMARNGHAGLQACLVDVARLLGRNLASAIQMFGVSDVRITGPLAPLFLPGRDAFLEGLAEVIGARVAAVDVQVTPDPKARLLAGATRAARRAFLYPDEFTTLSRMSITLQGQKLAGI